jgi:hypothetical protein
MPLSEMRNKQLYLSGWGGPGGRLTVSLFGDGCPLLIPNSTQATLNGRAMEVDVGHQVSGLEKGPCYQPLFDAHFLDDRLGETLTVTISDHSQTLRVALADYHPAAPILGPLGPNISRGQSLSVAFSATTDLPDVVQAWLDVDSNHATGAPCYFSDKATAAIADGRVDLQLPSGICQGPATLHVCLTYSRKTHLSGCENATCKLDSDFTTRGCGKYDVTVL